MEKENKEIMSKAFNKLKQHHQLPNQNNNNNNRDNKMNQNHNISSKFKACSSEMKNKKKPHFHDSLTTADDMILFFFFFSGQGGKVGKSEMLINIADKNPKKQAITNKLLKNQEGSAL